MKDKVLGGAIVAVHHQTFIPDFATLSYSAERYSRRREIGAGEIPLEVV